MKTKFSNRTEAGELLARKLSKHAGRRDALVLALPRGGVPVAFVVAERLHLPLDVLVVRKLGVPGREELALGAIASDGVRVLNAPIVAALHLSSATIEAVTAREQPELARRERVYRNNRPAPPILERTVLLVDDGIATGATMRAAIHILRQQRAGCIVVAAPVIAAATRANLRREADEVVSVLAPEEFSGVGEWFEDFAQITDEQVQVLLAAAATHQGNP